MSIEATKTPNGESGRKKVSRDLSKLQAIKKEDVDNELMEKILKDFNIRVGFITPEFTIEEVQKSNDSSSSTTSDSSNTTAGKHTNILNMGEFDLKKLPLVGYVKLAARDITPKIKNAKRLKKKEQLTKADSTEMENDEHAK